jgi:hypothetical protein
MRRRKAACETLRSAFRELWSKHATCAMMSPFLPARVMMQLLQGRTPPVERGDTRARDGAEGVVCMEQGASENDTVVTRRSRVPGCVCSPPVPGSA